VPQGSRAQLQGYDWLRNSLTDAGRNEIVGKLGEVAASLGCTVGQLAIAWILTNPDVSTVITGASNVTQIGENMLASEVARKITPEIKAQIEAVVGDAHD
jgi:aryl-alcohol dehydrogenase-like predicted oxidoreductase